MKKALNLLALSILTSSSAFAATACRNPLTGGGNSGTPPIPPIKDVAYYQQLIKATKSDIADCEQWIKDIQTEWDKDEDHQIPDAEYQMAIDQVTAEKYSYEALINEYQYQILLLQKQDDKFSPDQILLGIIIFTKRVSNLEQELTLKAKYPLDYPAQELEKIKNDIKTAKEILAIFEKLKEEEK